MQTVHELFLDCVRLVPRTPLVPPGHFVITIGSFVSFLKLYISLYDNLFLDSHSTHKQMSFNVSVMMLTQHLKF